MQGGVRKRGKKWYYYFDIGIVNGKRKKIERVGGTTKKEALTSLRKAIDDYENSGCFIDEVSMSVVDYFNYWYKEYVLINCKYNTQQYYRRIIDNHINPSLGLYKIKSLKPAILQELINNKYLMGFSKSSISSFYGVLSKAFRMAVYPYQLIKKNPMEYIEMPKIKEQKKDKSDLKVISKEDFNKIILRFPKESSFYIPLMISYHTGMRASEVCGLTWDCVDFQNKSIKINKILVGKGMGIWEYGTPKTKSSTRSITIGTTLINILKSHKINQLENRIKYGNAYHESDHICTKRNGEIITTNSLKYLSRVVNYELKITFNFHSLRHTHATMLLEAGANIKDIQERLGHNTLTTTMDTYSHVTAKMKQDTINIFESIIK